MLYISVSCVFFFFPNLYNFDRIFSTQVGHPFLKKKVEAISRPSSAGPISTSQWAYPFPVVLLSNLPFYILIHAFLYKAYVKTTQINPYPFMVAR